MNLRVLFVASELAPIVKVGGLGDVIGALPKALMRLGVEISVMVPRYEFVSRQGLRVLGRRIPIQIAHKKEEITLYRGRLPESRVAVFFVENNRYLSRGPAPYFEQTAFAGGEAEVQRFVFFSKAVATLLSDYSSFLPRFDIIHCHDWHTGALAALLRKLATDNRNAQQKVVFTIHNLSNQGRWNRKAIDRWFLPKGKPSPFTPLGRDYNFIAEGIMNADQVTTVSPTYAKEILTKTYGAGLERFLRRRKRRLAGILNGIDYTFYNPETDQKIWHRFSLEHPEEKRVNKTALQQKLGLAGDPRIPLFGLVSRLTDQKGVDLLFSLIPFFVKKFGAQFAFLGSGDIAYEKKLRAYARMFPKNVFTRIGFDERLGHRIYAASDFFLMPSRFEPSGLGQMIAMRYGTIPIVRATGGLKDSVHDNKTGIVFKDASSVDLKKAIERAIGLYQNPRGRMREMQRRCFRARFDFSKSGMLYRKLYAQILEKTN